MTRDGRDAGAAESAAEFATGRHRKLRAPREDRGVLIDPAWQTLPDVIARNVAQREGWDFRLAGESIAAFAAAARAEFVAEALAYTQAYRDATAPANHCRLLLAGHQPELFHPGVWAKNFALSGLASATGATAVNLMIDGDTLKAASLRVINRSATRDPVAGVVSVSMCNASMFRPSTPPFALNSLMATIAPRRSSTPDAAYWPEASMVRPITSGFFCADWAQAWLTFQGPKNVAPAAPAAIVPSRERRVLPDGASGAGDLCSCSSMLPS